MILSRSNLPAWVKPLPDVAERFSVFYGDGAPDIVFQYVFAIENGEVALKSIHWWMLTGDAAGLRDVAMNLRLLPDVLIAAGLEAQRRAGKRPKRSPFWWVVRLIEPERGWVLYLSDAGFVSGQRKAVVFVRRGEAKKEAARFFGADVVRVRARGAS